MTEIDLHIDARMWTGTALTSRSSESRFTISAHATPAPDTF
eukprot:COSAG05_NODE_18739_length_303_cov_2.000000_1_plen_40_part_10